MSNEVLKVGDVVKHVYDGFSAFKFWVAKVDGDVVGCRYRSFTKGESASSNYQIHYVEFHPSELTPYK
jgi:hypothetical protein